MKYTKPEVQCLGLAAQIVQSGSKGIVTTADSVYPHTTVSAYEADE